MKILIGVDGSDVSLDAVGQAGSLLSPARDEVGLYYSPPKIQFHDPATHGPDLVERARRALADAVFEEARGRLPAGLAHSVHTIVGNQAPSQGLIAAADDWRAELIVMGAAASKEKALGGTARAVARSATTPVLVTRPRPASDSGWRVLVTYDESETGRRVLDAVAHLSWPAGSEGYLMTIVESLLLGEVPAWLEAKARDADSEAMAQAWVREHDAERAAAKARLTALADQLPAAFQGREPIVDEGNPTEHILSAIAAKKINLVVLGAQGKNAWQRLLIGSTSEAVLERAGCSVLLVRRREKP